MKKICCLVFSLFLGTWGLSTVVWAGGYEGSGVGVRALSMGGAFTGLADDWSAAYWNPAGLAFQQGWGVGGSIDFLALRRFDGNSIANPPITQVNIEQGDPFFQLGGEPTRFNTTDTTIHAALPSMVGYKIWDRLAFSLGVFSPLGYAFDLGDNSIPGYSMSYKSQGYMIDYNLSVAYRLNSMWALGAGLHILDGRMSRDANKDTPLYRFTASSEGRGNAFQGVVGLLGRLHEKVSMGLAYKMRTTMTLDGTASVNSPIIHEDSTMHSDLLSPAVYLVGFAFRPTSSLTLTTDWHGTDWRPFRVATRFDQQGQALQNLDLDGHWRFTNRLRAGGEYRHSYQTNRSLIGRLGYTWDPYAVSDAEVSITNFVDVSRHVFTAGLSWQLGAWEPDLGIVYAQGSRTINGVDYKAVDRLLTVGVHYHIL